MSAAGIYILFAPGARPDRDVMLKFVTANPSVAISHDPAGIEQTHADVAGGPSRQPRGDAGDQDWLELLKDGLTFDLRGLASGSAVVAPEVRHFFDFPDPGSINDCEAILLEPGPHLAGGESALPIVRGMMALTCELLEGFDEICGVIWPPAQSLIGYRYFESIMSAWLDGGPFPALGLTAFSTTADGGLQSVGLSHFIDRELRIDAPLSQDNVAATRLAVRLVNQLILLGGIEGEERVVTTDGTRLILQESQNRRFIRVRAE